MKKIKEDIINIGVYDYEVDLFEGQYLVPNGISYNSYLVVDEQITILDSVDNRFAQEWLSNIEKILQDKSPDYLIIQHMEPDHSGSIHDFIQKYPSTKVVSNTKVFTMMNQFFDIKEPINQLIVRDGETLHTGKHIFTFLFAPMVHWPEVMVTYDSHSKTLFSADAFGTFGIYPEDAVIQVADWVQEAARYYFGIVAKYGLQVQALLKKVAPLDLEIICSIHGPTLTHSLTDFIHLYDTWSTYTNEKEGVVIAYASAYGHTEKAANFLATILQEKGCPSVILHDVARCDSSLAIANAFRYSTVVFASITYNMSISPFMNTFIHSLVERNFQNKLIGLIENGSWAPCANKIMKYLLENSKKTTWLQNQVCIHSALNGMTKKTIHQLADEIIDKMTKNQLL